MSTKLIGSVLEGEYICDLEHNRVNEDHILPLATALLYYLRDPLYGLDPVIEARRLELGFHLLLIGAHESTASILELVRKVS